MDFAALPPEINSARMYSGPGGGPMLAAAAAWDGLAAELHSTAISYGSVISGLTSGSWLGPASASMAVAAARYVAWLHIIATQAEQAASQAKAAVAAYEAAFGMTVPPPVIAANRALLMSLIATNFLGQNTPAIAATQAHYAEMWAQDAAAMYGYAVASAAATSLTPFTEPPPTTNPAGPAGQAAAVAQTAGTAARTGVEKTLSQLTSAVAAALQGPFDPPPLPPWVADLQTLMSIFGTPFFVSTSSAGLMMSGLSTLKSMVPAESVIPAAVAGGATALGPALTGGLGSGAGALNSTGLGGAAVSAGMGRAASIGALSVPQAWAPTIGSAGAAVLPSGPGAIPEVGAAGPGGLLGGLPIAAAAARGAGGAARRDGILALRVLPRAAYTG